MDWKTLARELTDPSKSKEKPEALDDLVVIDISYGNFAGLFASSLLSELGAKVIRVEPPEGDIARKMTPYGLEIDGTGLPYIVEGRNKYHITLNIEKEEGKEIFIRLIRKADILIETFPTGKMEKLGLGWDTLKRENGRLIMCSIKTFGERGYYAENEKVPDAIGTDVVDQARSGVAWTVGIPEEYDEFPEHTRVPTRMGNWMAHYAGGAIAAFAIMCSVLYRNITGEGQKIDISPAEALMAMNNYALQCYHLTGRVINRVANFEPAAYAYNYFRTKDGLVFIAGYADPNWKALCTIINRPDLIEKYPTIKDRTNPDNFIPMTREIESVIINYTRKEVVKMWLEYDGPGVTVAGEILKPKETLQFNHWFERGALIRVKDKELGDLILQGVAAKMSKTPPRIKWICRKPGEDNEFFYLTLLNIDKEELKKLEEENII